MIMSNSISRIPIFITGCQRSGTTLLNLILNSHPKIWSIDEDIFLFQSIYRYLSVPQMPPFVAFKLPEYAHILPFIKMLPDIRVVWCIRDPIDTVWSMVKLQLTVKGVTAPWAVHPSGGGWSQIMNSYWVLSDESKNDLAAPMKEYFRISEKFSSLSLKDLENIDRRDSVFMGALCWRIKNELPTMYKAEKIDFHTAKYEDLVANPKERIAEILHYIGVDWSDEVLKHHQLHRGGSIGDTSNTRSIDKKSVAQGKKNFSQEELSTIESICGKTAREWGY